MSSVFPIGYVARPGLVVPVGRLVWNANDAPGRRMAFQFSEQWQQAGFALGGDLPVSAAACSPAIADPDAPPVFGFIRDLAPCPLFKPLLEGGDRSAMALWAAARGSGARFGALVIGDSDEAPAGPAPEINRKSMAAAQSALATLMKKPAALTADERAVLAASALPAGGSRPKLCFAGSRKLPGDWILHASLPGDEFNRGAWTALTRELAMQCGIGTVAGHYVDGGYLEARFDRKDGAELLCLSARTLLARRP
ncbi:MAG: hypothetical protein HUK26_09475, partial [Duodenibacillus sp.]|nr:hypothetical protein [Duodenibacillus sp.]